jgi:hypothetical protein
VVPTTLPLPDFSIAASIHQVVQRGKIHLRATDHDIPLIHQYRQTNQGKSFTGAIDAQTCIRFIDCPMGEADEVSAVIGEELIPNEIQRSGHVTTPIDVGVIISLIVD